MRKNPPKPGHGAYGAWLHKQHLAQALQTGAGFAFGSSGLEALGTKLAQAEALERSILTDLAKFEALAGPAATVDFLALVQTIFATRVQDRPRRGRPKGTGPHAELDRKAIGAVKNALRQHPGLRPTTVMRELSRMLAQKDGTGNSEDAILQRLKVAWRDAQLREAERQEG